MRKIIALILLALLVSFSAEATNKATFPTTPLFVAHAQYNFAVDGGADTAITPAVNSTIPANAVIVATTINVTTAVLSAGAATVGVGTGATGGTGTSFLAQTAKASLSLNALLPGAVTFAAPLKVTTAGQITITPAVATLTAGVIEIWVQYYIAAN